MADAFKFGVLRNGIGGRGGAPLVEDVNEWAGGFVRRYVVGVERVRVAQVVVGTGQVVVGDLV